ncbi:MAG: ACT domain-containing protein [Methanomicrobiales archaeon]|nr:ACT domain-containing protein [Methanomicrobiales archaeon]
MGSNERFTFIARMPDEPGALRRAAEAIGRHGGNIVRLHYDHRIDPSTVFFELEAEREDYDAIREELKRIGYLQHSLHPSAVLKFCVRLPHRPGALLEFLGHTTEERANITLVDFDERGAHPDRLKVSLSLEESAKAERLLDRLKSRYPIEILEYDPSGKDLDDTVFYVRFAQELRGLLEKPDEEFILSMLHDTNHIVQELHNRGRSRRRSSRACWRRVGG